MAEAKLKTFIVERSNASGGSDKIEVQAERGEQDSGSSRVTFFVGTDAVASFINTQGWYQQS